MEAKDLRIGNWVNVIKSVPVQITANHIVAISEGDGQYSPVPLTEDWLEKFGFKVEYGYGVVYFLNDDEPIGIEYKRDGDKSFHVIIRNHGSCCDSYEHPKRKGCIQYVHQIQNLFFALTGEELTISEKTANIESC